MVDGRHFEKLPYLGNGLTNGHEICRMMHLEPLNCDGS